MRCGEEEPEHDALSYEETHGRTESCLWCLSQGLSTEADPGSSYAIQTS